MKKIFTYYILLVLTLSNIDAQTFTLYTMHSGGSIITGTVTNGALLSYSTTINAETKQRFRIANTSATNTYTYNIKRTIMAQNPVLTVSGVSVVPQTYFCAGIQCYDNSVTTQTNTAEMTVIPAGSNSDAESMPLMVYLDEASSLGYYVVRYKVYNYSVPGDTITFTMKYNDYLGVDEIGKSIVESGEVFPNPVSNEASIYISLKQESNVKIQVYNSIGSLVFTSPEQKYPQGKNKLNVNCASLSQGLYFVQINAGSGKVTKRLIINK